MFWVKNELKNGFWMKRLKLQFSSHYSGWNLGKSDDMSSEFFFKKNLGQTTLVANKKIIIKGPILGA